jgi:hypothetical protein
MQRRDDRTAQEPQVRAQRPAGRPGQAGPGACAVNRSITDGCSKMPGAGSRPVPIPKSASLPAAHRRFFARSCPPGAASPTTARANPAARGDTEDGRQPAM